MRKRMWALALGATVLAGTGSGLVAQQPTPAKPVSQSAAGKPVAVVNGEPISMAQIDALLNREGPQAVQVPETKLRDMRQMTLAAMIDDVLFQQYIRKNCPPAGSQEIEQEVAKLQEALKKGNKTLEDFCKENGSTLKEMREDVGDILRWKTLVTSKTPDAELQRYYTQYKDLFDQTAVRASHIVIRVTPTTTDAEKQATVAKLKALRADVVAGKIDFAAAAQQHSQCVSAKQGGDLNYFPRKFMVDENFARTAFAMKVGEVSDVVQTEFGYHLIKVTDRKPGTPSDFAKIKEDVREVYALELRNLIIQEQRKTAKVEVNLP